jgi:sensor histidine kinase YesM
MPQPAAQDTPAPRSFAENLRLVLSDWWSATRHTRAAPAWMYWAWTGVFSTGIALVLSAFFLASNQRATLVNTLWETWVISMCIGYSIHVLFEATFRVAISPARLEAMPSVLRGGLFVGLSFLGVMIGYTISFALQGRNFVSLVMNYPRAFSGLLFIGLSACVAWYFVMAANAARYKLEAEKAQHAAAAEASQRQASVAELAALQAQIEPHFLFNTLANVQALIDYDAPKAKHMLESFIEYLRATLDASRRSHATVGDELALVERYLQLLEVRMGTRLRYEIDATPEARALSFAPLMLQPLVENAVKYGLEPKIDGGTVTITARVDGNRAVLTVADDGMGLPEAHNRTDTKSTARKGAGVGLANVRARLQALYGQTATLTVASQSVGTLSTININL